jgi:integrase
MDTLKAFLTWAYELEYIEKLPLFPTISIDFKIPQWMQEQEQGAVLSFLPENDRFAYLFLMLHGCRPSEARALQVQDINFEHGSIIFRRVYTGRSGNTLIERTKAHRQRVIPINPDMEHILRELCMNKLPSSFVFTDSKTGNPYPSRTLVKRWQVACKKAGKK